MNDGVRISTRNQSSTKAIPEGTLVIVKASYFDASSSKVFFVTTYPFYFDTVFAILMKESS